MAMLARSTRAPLPVVGVTAMMLARPALWRLLASGSVSGYALTPAGWDSLLSTPPAQPRAPAGIPPPAAPTA
jgi:hypothetical protein